MKNMISKRNLVLWIVAVGWTILLSIIGNIFVKPLFSEDFISWVYIILLSMIILLFFIIGFFVIYVVKRKQNQKRTYEELTRLRDGGTKLQNELENKLNRTILYSYIYTVFLLAVVFPLSVLSYIDPGFSIFPIYIWKDLLSRIFPEKEDIDRTWIVSENDYPLQYALVNQAKSVFGEQRPVLIYHAEGFSAMITCTDREIYLGLGVIMLDCFSKEELYQVLLHEFAHTQDKKQAYYHKHVKIAQENSYFFIIFNTLIDNYYNLFCLFSAYKQEITADRLMCKHGNPQTAAEAFAKTAFFDYFEKGFLSPKDSLTLSYYKNDAMPKDWISTYTNCFRNTVQSNLTFAMKIIENELPPRVYSHPIIRDRINALGVTDYTVTFPEHQDSWGKEIKKTLSDVDCKYYELNKNDFPTLREENYLNPAKAISDWITSGKPLTYEATRSVLDAYHCLDSYQEAIALCHTLYESGNSEQELAHAYFIEGLCQLKLRNPAGIQRLYQAMNLNDNYIDYGSDQIDDYCTTMGLKNELVEYRTYIDNILHTQTQSQPVFPLKKNDRLEAATDLDPNFSENLETITNVCGDYLHQVFLIKKSISEQTYFYIYLLDLLPETPDELAGSFFETIFVHLDKYQEHYLLEVYEKNTGKNWLEKHPEYIVYQNCK